MDGFTKEYWTIQTEPGIIMPFYLLRPDKPNGAAVINPHGHDCGKDATVENTDNPAVTAGRAVNAAPCFPMRWPGQGM